MSITGDPLPKLPKWLCRVASGLEKSGKCDIFSRSGNCQGILKSSKWKIKILKRQGKSQGKINFEGQKYIFKYVLMRFFSHSLRSLGIYWQIIILMNFCKCCTFLSFVKTYVYTCKFKKCNVIDWYSKGIWLLGRFDNRMWDVDHLSWAISVSEKPCWSGKSQVILLICDAGNPALLHCNHIIKYSEVMFATGFRLLNGLGWAI